MRTFEWGDSANETWMVPYVINRGALDVVGTEEGVKTSRICSAFSQRRPLDSSKPPIRILGAVHPTDRATVRARTDAEA